MAETAYQRYRRYLDDPASVLGLPASSRLGSAINSGAQFVGEQLPTIAEATRFGNPFTAPQRFAEFLTAEQPALSGPSRLPSRTPSVRRAPDFDSIPGADEHGVTDLIRRPKEGLAPVLDKVTGENMPGIRIRPSDLTTRTPGDALAIEGLRKRSGVSLRPLMAAPGEGGGPMSLADMEGRSRAMNMLDDFFTNDPQARRIEEAEGRALENRFEMEAADPLFRERGKADIEMNRLLGLEGAKQQFAGAREQERRNAFGNEMKALSDQIAADMVKAKGILDPAQRQEVEAKIQERFEQQQQNIRQKYGLGAGLNASGIWSQGV